MPSFEYKCPGCNARFAIILTKPQAQAIEGKKLGCIHCRRNHVQLVRYDAHTEYTTAEIANQMKSIMDRLETIESILIDEGMLESRIKG